MWSDVASKWPVLLRSTAFRKPLAMLETYSFQRLDNGSRHSLHRRLQLTWWVLVSIFRCDRDGPILTWLCPGLLAYRIWKIEFGVSRARVTNSSTMPILRVLVDAALLYSVTLLPALICFICANNGQFVMIDMVILFLHVLKSLLSFGQSDHADHLDCLLHGAYSHRD
jgi:hypothetical protein